MEILKIHATPMRKTGEIGEFSICYSCETLSRLKDHADSYLSLDYEAIVKLSEGFNGAGTFLLQHRLNGTMH